jgi:transposase
LQKAHQHVANQRKDFQHQEAYKLVQAFATIAIAKKALSERVHRCDCGLTMGRDHAAALVILGRGLRLQAQTDRHLATVA